jgi:hypothetical protein
MDGNTTGDPHPVATLFLAGAKTRSAGPGRTGRQG